MHPHRRLKEDLAAYDQRQFPERSDAPDLEDLWDELFLLDSLVGRAVSAVANGIAVNPEELTSRRDLRSRIEDVASEADGDRAEEARAYLEQLDALEGLLAEARALARGC
jgi:hypothetical protein